VKKFSGKAWLFRICFLTRVVIAPKIFEQSLKKIFTHGLLKKI